MILKRVFHVTGIGMLILSTCWLVQSSAHCQAISEIELHFSRLSVEDGLPYTTLRSIHIDSDGFMWIAYNFGIIRYDGYDLEYMDEITPFVPQISSSGTFLEDKRGNMWMGGRFGQVAHYNRSAGILYKIEIIEDDNDTSQYSFIRLQESSDGKIFLLCRMDRRGTEKIEFALYTLDPGKFEFSLDSNIIIRNQIADAAISVIPITGDYGSIWDFVIDDNDDPWIATEKGMVKYDIVYNAFELHQIDSSLPESEVNTCNNVIKDQNGIFWIGGKDKLLSFNPAEMQYQQWPLKLPLLSNELNVFAGAIDDDGNLWCRVQHNSGRKNDIVLFNLNSKEYSILNLSAWDHVRNITMGHFCKDDQGNIFFAQGPAGIFRHSQEKSRFNLIRPDSTIKSGLRGNGFISVYKDKNDVLIGSVDGILNRWNLKTREFTHLNDVFGDPLKGNPPISCIIRDSMGVLWVGTMGNGVFRQNTDGSFRHYRYQDDDTTSFGLDFVLEMHLDNTGKLWFGGHAKSVGQPLMRYRRNCDCFDRLPRHPNNDYGSAWTIIDSEDEGLWIGGGRVWHYDVKTDKQIELAEVGIAHDLHLDGDNNLWEADYNSEFRNWALNEDTIRNQYSMYDPYPKNPLRSIIENDDGTYWIAGAQGLIHFDPMEGRAIKMYRTENWRDESTPWFSWVIKGTRLTDGRLLYANAGGLLEFTPAGIDQQIPKVSIIGLKAGGQAYGDSRHPGFFVQHSYVQDVTLAYNKNDIDIKYVGLYFKDSEGTQYKYILEGWDEAWKHAGNLRSVSYANVSPGKYTFKVIAGNADDVWMDKTDATTLKITVQPPFWKTYSAYGVYLIMVFGGLWWIRRSELRKHRVKSDRQAEKLKQQELVNDQLVRLDGLKDQFLANTSHELRTPLNGIIGIAESLQDGIAGQLTNKAMTNLDIITSSAHRLSSLINDILDFSKLKHEDIQLKTGPLDMHSALDVVFTLSQPVIRHKSIKLVNNIPADIKLVEADENRVQQILHNLIGNAIKFTEDGQIIANAHVDSDQLVVSIADTGIGIHEEKLDLIFQKFVQVDGAQSREYTGTGLGLAITRQLVELHGGEITVDSNPDEGSVFTFTLPLSKVSRSDLPKIKVPLPYSELSSLQFDEPATKLTESPDPISDASARVLIVDDESVNLQVLENHLSLAGYYVQRANNGHEALKILEHDNFDLIILDIMMPKMSGYEVCQIVREKYLPSQLPIIMLTAKNQVTDLVDGFSAGANDYLTKPISKNELLSRVKTHVNLHQIHKATGKFVPYEFLQTVGRNEITEVRLGDHKQKEVTVLFSDIRDFTKRAEKMTPTENFDFVSNYVSQMGPSIHQNKGFVNQYLGDGIMAVFPKESDHALKAAIEMQKTIGAYNISRRWDEQELKVGMGLHTGKLVMGIIGDEVRNETATIAETVNTASRIEGLTKYFGANILISKPALDAIRNPGDFHFRYIGPVQVKGSEMTLGVYECFDGDIHEVFNLKLKSKDKFKGGMDKFLGKEFGASTAIFDEIFKENQQDIVAKYFRTKSAHYTIQGVPKGWTGVERLISK